MKLPDYADSAVARVRTMTGSAIARGELRFVTAESGRPVAYFSPETDPERIARSGWYLGTRDFDGVWFYADLRLCPDTNAALEAAWGAQECEQEATA